MHVGGAVFQLDFDRDNFILEATFLYRALRLDMAGERKLVQLILRQLVFLRQHFSAGELVELHTGIALGYFLAVGHSVVGFEAVDNICADGYLAHTLHAAGDHQILGTREHTLRREVHRLLT